MKSRDGKSQREEKSRRKKSRRENIREEKESEERRSGARKGRKVARHCVFPMICGSGNRKVGLLKRRVQSHLARWEMKNCTPLWHRAHAQVKKLKTPHVRTTFGNWDVEKVHAVVARSTFASEKAKKNLTFGPLLEIEMSKNCTPLWREAHLQVKKLKETSRSDHFWKLRCQKSARRCGAKHICKWKS